AGFGGGEQDVEWDRDPDVGASAAEQPESDVRQTARHTSSRTRGTVGIPTRSRSHGSVRVIAALARGAGVSTALGRLDPRTAGRLCGVTGFSGRALARQSRSGGRFVPVAWRRIDVCVGAGGA